MRYLLLLSTIFMLCAISCENRQQATASQRIAQNQHEANFNATRLKDDVAFAVNAADGGLMQVELGTLALSKGVYQQTRDFGALMVADHSKVNEELQALAQKKNITLPTALSKDKLRKYEELNTRQAGEFDKAYLSYMIDDHQEDLKAFKEQAAKGKDKELRNWAGSKISILEQHLAQAKETDSILSYIR